MIRDGAALIRSAEDVFEALSGPRTLALAEPGREFLFDDDAFGDDYGVTDYDSIDDFDGDDRAGAALAEQILRLLSSHPVEIDEIARQCGASPAEFSLAILELDLAGRIDLLAGGLIVGADPAG
jgi:DNA processing protein